MVLGIRDVQGAAGKRHSLGPKEGGLIECSVLRSVDSRPNGFDQGAVEFRDHDAIVIRVSYEQTFALLIRQHFAGKGQRKVADFGPLEDELERRFIQFSTLPQLSYRVGKTSIH